MRLTIERRNEQDRSDVLDPLGVALIGTWAAVFALGDIADLMTTPLQNTRLLIAEAITGLSLIVGVLVRASCGMPLTLIIRSARDVAICGHVLHGHPGARAMCQVRCSWLLLRLSRWRFLDMWSGEPHGNSP